MCNHMYYSSQRRSDRKRWGNNQNKICARNKVVECVVTAKMAEVSQLQPAFSRVCSGVL